jgi:peroxiredoxin
MSFVTSAIRQHWFSTALLAISAALLFQNISLARANGDIRTRFDRVMKQHVEVGDHIGDIRGTTLGGQQLTESALRTPRSLIISMSVNCSVCAVNMSAWRRLASKARATGRVHVMWVSRDTTSETRAFLQREPIEDGLIADPTYVTHLQLKLSVVPQTIVTDANGLVVAALVGAVDSTAETAVARTFDSAQR